MIFLFEDKRFYREQCLVFITCLLKGKDNFFCFILVPTHFHARDEPIEVYLLYKSLDADVHVANRVLSHHVLVFKTSNNEFYYTDLQTDDGGVGDALRGRGRIRLRFARYTFYPGPWAAWML
jgi:hypothetical protein